VEEVSGVRFQVSGVRKEGQRQVRALPSAVFLKPET